MSSNSIERNTLSDSQNTVEKGPEKTLREQAEDFVRNKSDIIRKNHESLTPDELQKLILELEINQVELEMQNRELLRVQKELEKSREWYLDLYDMAPTGYFTISPDGKIVEANLTAASLLEVDRNTICGHLFTKYIEPEDREIFDIHQKDLFKTGNKQMFELRISKKNDLWFWAKMEMILVCSADNLLTCRAVISDITERKNIEEEKHKIEEQIVLNQRLESLGILAGGIAHNFNNLLMGVFGYIELANRKTDNPEVSKYLSEALNMSERAKGLTGQLLTFSRGGAPIKNSGYLFPIVKESVQFALSGSDIACRFNIANDLYPCDFDTNQICQVIDDVILNARQAMPGGGVIDVSASNITLKYNEIATLSEGNYVMISIRDYGVGMSPEILSRIFDPFFTTKANGYGLGLAKSYSIIKRHGGSIKVESEPGKGCLVNIYLPAAAEAVQFKYDKTEELHTGNGTIIIMDDEECIRDSIAGMLMSMGYDVIHMEDGEEVIDFFKDESNAENKISGVILDLVIPGGRGGKDTVTEIRKMEPDIPLFAISGYADDPVIENPESYGFTASISKPFLMNELAEILGRYLKD